MRDKANELLFMFSFSHEFRVADFKEYIKILSADSDFKYAEQFEVCVIKYFTGIKNCQAPTCITLS